MCRPLNHRCPGPFPFPSRRHHTKPHRLAINGGRHQPRRPPPCAPPPLSPPP
jgi:hypothetical protein